MPPTHLLVTEHTVAVNRRSSNSPPVLMTVTIITVDSGDDIIAGAFVGQAEIKVAEPSRPGTFVEAHCWTAVYVPTMVLKTVAVRAI